MKAKNVSTGKHGGKTSTRRYKRAGKSDDLEGERTLYVGNVPRHVTRKAIKALFAKFGHIETVRLRGLIARKPNVTKRIALADNRLSDNFQTVIFYVRFQNAADAAEAVRLNSTLQFGRHIRVSLSTKTKMQLHRTVFVGNLAYSADEEEVRHVFAEYGNVTDVRLVRDRYTGAGKGFGYVQFSTPEEASAALKAEDVVLGNRNLRVQPAVKPEQVRQLGKKKQFDCIVEAGRVNTNEPRAFSRPGRPRRKRRPMKTSFQNKQTIRLTK